MTGGYSKTVAKILAYQLLVITLVSAGFMLGGWHKTLSSMMGGLAAFVPNMYFAFRLAGTRNRDPGKILRSFYIGESVKLLLTAALFILILQIPNIEIIPLLAGFAAALSVFWFALLMR